MLSLFLIADCREIDSTIEKLLEHLQQFKFAHDFYRTVRHRFALQEVPEIVFRQDDYLNHLSQRHFLRCAPGPDFAIALLDIRLVFPQQPLAEMAIDLVNPLAQFMDRKRAKAAEASGRHDLLLQAGSQRIGMSLYQTH